MAPPLCPRVSMDLSSSGRSEGRKCMWRAAPLHWPSWGGSQAPWPQPQGQGQVGMVWAIFGAFGVPLRTKGSTLLLARTVDPSEARSWKPIQGPSSTRWDRRHLEITIAKQAPCPIRTGGSDGVWQNDHSKLVIINGSVQSSDDTGRRTGEGEQSQPSRLREIWCPGCTHQPQSLSIQVASAESLGLGYVGMDQSHGGDLWGTHCSAQVHTPPPHPFMSVTEARSQRESLGLIILGLSGILAPSRLLGCLTPSPAKHWRDTLSPSWAQGHNWSHSDGLHLLATGVPLGQP